MFNRILILIVIVSITFLCCTSKNRYQSSRSAILNKEGKTIASRFNCPKGFKRPKLNNSSFAWYLSHLPLKPDGSPVKLYNGDTKEVQVHEAVVDMEIGNQDLQQCADAVMRLRGEYLYKQGRYSEISFTFNNGFEAEYSRWMQGERIILNGSEHHWEKRKEPSNTYADFRKYMDEVFSFAGTLSLSKTLKSKPINKIEIGDVFIKGGSPGHAVIVVDVATDSTGNKVFMIAQSYMPAQEIHVLKNLNEPDSSPWYYLSDIKNDFKTPEWDFKSNQLMGW